MSSKEASMTSSACLTMVHRSASTDDRTLPGLPPFCYHIFTRFLPQFAVDMSILVTFVVTLSPFSLQLAYYMMTLIAALLPLCHWFLPQFYRLCIHICLPFVPSLSPIFVVVLLVICPYLLPLCHRFLSQFCLRYDRTFRHLVDSFACHIRLHRDLSLIHI